MERKGQFMIYQRFGHIGTGESELETNHERQVPLYPPDVEKAIKEQKEKEQVKKEQTESKTVQKPLLPYYVKTDER